jgi:modulator of FtsH protease
MLPLAEWQTLFSVEAGCAATLTGLVFVAVSINIAKILAAPGLPGRAAESIAQFLQVFFVCMAGMIPRQPAGALAVEIICVALLCWTLQLISQINYARSRSVYPQWWLVTRVVQTQLGCLPLFVGAICILSGASASLYWLALGFFFSFLAGVVNAWILLIEIHR